MTSVARRAQAPKRPDEGARVLTTAVAEVARRRALRPTELHAILGISQPSASRLLAGRFTLAAATKPCELAALLVRIDRSLLSVVGSDDLARAWLRAANLAFDGRAPLLETARAEGMVHVGEYLVAHRARV